ncbi:hypothetical protein [Mesorhizobium sp. B2-4-12]|uniref:hypothetical protein n=1 Tax=Mesorhizobium sp. B2-4-12 TaxID=2589937 RepID=UPI001FF0129F|nr:hypothetical protein [Mesorhizobium sp. B2-4-12]
MARLARGPSGLKNAGRVVTIKHGGRFFLPYQLHYTARELLASYPELPAFLAAKRQYDPTELFSSTVYRAIKALGRAAS